MEGIPVITYYLSDGVTKTDPSNSGAASNGAAPVKAGNYTVMISIPESDPQYMGSATLEFTVAKKDVTVAPKNFSITKGEIIPSFELTYTGLVSGDVLTPSNAPCFTCFESDGSTAVSTNTGAGTYIITWANQANTTFSGIENYNVIKIATGALIIENPSASGSGGGGVASYAINIEKALNGAIVASRTRAEANATVILTVEAEKGYKLNELKVTNDSGRTIIVLEKNNQYRFQMPASAVTVSATFVKIGTDILNPFADVKQSDYFYDAVLWAVNNGVAAGTGATTFSPNETCTRAQIVTFLWNAAGAPIQETTAKSFTDIAKEDYFYHAALWAMENGITVGTSNTTFSPNAPCTRSQAVTFMWRAAGNPVVTGNSFNDVASDAWYAKAVAWAVENNITAGIGENLFGPDEYCTRAQIVMFLWKLMS